LSADGESPRDLVQRARASVEMGRPELGLPLAARAAAMAPNDAWVLTNLAWLQHATNRYDEALRTCAQAIAANPEYEWPHRLRGYVLRETGRPEAAASALAEAVRLEPNEPRALRTFAWFASVVGRAEEALRAANRAVELEPEEAESWFALGWAARANRDWETAEAALLRSRALDPGGSVHHNNLGTLYLKLGRLDEAMDCFRSALEIDSRSEYAFLNLARCLRRLDRWEEAADLGVRHWLNRLHGANERVENVGDFSAWMARSYAEGWLLRLPEKADDLRHAARLAETPWETSQVKISQMSLAMSRVHLQEAVELARELLRDNSGDPTSLQASANVAWLAGDQALAERIGLLAAQQQDIGRRTESKCTIGAALASGRWRIALDELGTYLEVSLAAMLCCEHAQAAYAAHKSGDTESTRSYLRRSVDEYPHCHTLRVLDRLGLMPVRDLLPPEIQPWILSEEPLA
jgi:tetratricopeptide (TPR) repeat protein